MKKLLIFISALLCMAGFAYTQYLIFFVAPIQGVGDWKVATPLFFNQKIFYYHVPNAMMLFVAVITCGVSSMIFLKNRSGNADDVALAAGDISVLLGAITLLTGMVWGKVAWGKWWDWDARLTSSLLLWLTMVGYVLVRKYGGTGSERLAAGLAAFATVNVALVYFSVRIWRTLHPPTSVVPNLQGDQKAAFWMSVLLFLVFFVLLLVTRISVVRCRRHVDETRDLALDAGLIS